MDGGILFLHWHSFEIKKYQRDAVAKIQLGFDT
jgi:hypothetical protein